MKISKSLKKLKGDASLRTFFRNKKKNSSSIIVYANKNKRSNLLIYDSINQILLKNNILAPKLLSENYSKNYIEIEDFGDQTIFNLLKKSRTNKLVIFKRIIRLLNKLQYSVKSKKLIFKKKFIKVVKNLIKKLHYKNVTFVHRDFHVSNLMMVKNEIALIDTQDALIGNKAYDLASLIDDVRFKTSNDIKKKLFNYYLKSQKKINKLHIKNDFEIISVLRNLKIIGIFKRLAVRDKKKKYLKLIPNAWNLIKLRSKNNDKFKNLNELLGTIKKN